MKRYALRTGEALAIAPDAIKHDADGFYLMMGPDTPPSEREGTVAVVYVRGALAQFKTDAGDSYEAIVERVSEAIAQEPKPTSVVMCISSPGGVVAGLNESVKKLRRMVKDAGVPLIAYVDEMANSAAFALACAAEERIAPPSAVVGSVGVISTMVSVAKQDELTGVEFRLITSGKRKADGHLHAPISDAAVAAEKTRNDEMARQFFALASEATRLSPKKLSSLEAAIYLGAAARDVGLIDDVMGFDEVVGVLDQTSSAVPAAAPNEGNITDRRAKNARGARVPLDKTAQRESASTATAHVPQRATQNEGRMSVKIKSLIKRAEAALASATDPTERARLGAELAAFNLTQARAEHDEPDGDEPKDDDDEDESKAQKAQKMAEEKARKAEAAKHRAEAAKHKAKAAEYEEKAKAAEESGEEDGDEEAQHSEEEARAAGAAAAVTAQAGMAEGAIARIARLEKSAEDRERKAMIGEALTARRITPGEAKTLEKKPATFVTGFLEMRPNAIVNTDDSVTLQPTTQPTGTLPATTLASIETAVTAANLAGEAAEKMRAALIKSHQERAAQTNGAGGRY